jgi:hypothetical protein
VAREFEVLNASINVRTNSKNAEVNLDKITTVLDKVTKGGKLTVDQFTLLSQEASKASSTVKGLNATLKSNGATFDLTAKGAKTWAVSVHQGAVDTGAALTELSRRFEAIDKSAINTTRRFSQVSQDFFAGSRLILNGGNLLVGVRQQFFGTAESTNLFARALDNLTSGKSNNLFARFVDFATFGLTQISDRQKGVVRDSRLVAESLGNIGRASKAALDNLKDIAKTEGIAKKQDFAGLVTSINNVTNEYERLERVIRSGGRPTEAQLDRIQVEARALEQQFELLTVQGIIPADSKTREYLNVLLKGMGNGQQAVKVLSEQMKTLSNEEENAKQKAKNLGTAHLDGSKKAGGGWSFVFNLFRNNQSTINNLDNSVKRVSTSFRQSSQAGSQFGSILAGVFGGNILSQGLFNISNALSNLPSILISAASNAEETANRFRAVFKDTATEAQAFVDDLASDVGRDPFKIQDSLASFQSFNIGLGFSQDKSLDMSKTLQKLSLDFASFNNITDADAQQRFISALSGSSEVLDKYGINIKEAALEQESFRTGLNKASSELTEQEKTILRLSIISKSMGAQGAIGDAVTTAGSFANQTKRLQANLSLMATEIGTKLLPAIAPFLAILNQLIQVTMPAVTAAFGALFGGIQAFLQPIANALSDVFSAENTDVALNNLYIVVINALNNILIGINNFTADAFDWGVSFVNQIADGIFDAADSILTEAVNYVGDLIAGFLEPGSPPKEGPLSSIDKWGKGLLDTFGASMADSNFIDTLESKLAEASTKVLGIRQEIIDAERKGYVPPELLEKLRLAELEKKNIEEQINSEKQLTKEQKKQEPDKAAGRSGGGAGGRDSSAADRPKAEKKTAEEVRATALAVLEQQLKDGTIKYEDYVEEKLKIEKKFNQDTLEDGKKTTQENINNIKNLEKELEGIKDANKKEKKGKGLQSALDDAQVDKLLGGILGDAETVGETVGKRFVKSIGSSVTTSINELGNTTRESLKEFWHKFGFYLITGIHIALDFEKIKKLAAGEGLVAAILGKVNLLKPVQTLLAPLVNLVNNIANSFVGRAFTTVLDRLGIFGTLIRKLLGLVGRFAGPIGVLITIWSHWDDIVLLFNNSIQFANSFIDDFIKRLGGIRQATSIFDELIRSGKGFLIRIKGIFNTLLGDLGKIDFGLILNQIFSGDFAGAFNTLSTGLGNTFSKAFEKLKTLLANSTFDDLLTNLIQTGFITIQSVLGEQLLKLRDKFIQALPPGLVSFVDEIQVRFTSFSNFINLTLIPAITKVGNFFRDNLTPGFNIAKQSFSDFIATNAPQLTVAFEKIQSIISTLSERFSTVRAVIDEKIGPAFDRLTFSLGLAGKEGDETGALGKILKAFGLIAGFGIDILLDTITGAIDGFVIILDLVDKGLTKSEPLFKLWGEGVGRISVVLLDVGTSVTNSVTNIIDTFQWLYDELVGHSIIPDLVTGIMGILSPFKTDFIGIFSDAVTNALSFFTDMGKNIISNIVGGLQGGAATIGGAISGLFSGGGETAAPTQVDTTQVAQVSGDVQALVALVSAGITGLQALFNTFILNVQTLTLNLPNVVTSAFLALYNTMVGEDGLIQSLSSVTVGTIDSMVNSVLFTLQRLASEGGNTIKNAGWADIGKSIIDGLLEGIEQNKDEVIEVLKGLAKEAISGAKSELGIRSPSVVFRDIGVDMVDGLILGLKKMAPNIKSIIDNAAGIAEDAMGHFISDEQTTPVLNNIKAIFRDNFKEIVAQIKSGKNRGLIADALEKLVPGEAFEVGTGAADAIRSAIDALISNILPQAEKDISSFANTVAQNSAKVSEQVESIVTGFTTTLENVRFQTNNTRNQLEDFFKEPITDNKLNELFTQVTDQGVSFGEDIDSKIKLAFLSQQKLTGGLEDQLIIEEKIRKITEEQAKLNALAPKPPPVIPVTELEKGLKLLDALKLGLDASVPDVLDSLTGLSAQMVDALKKALQISSPSKLFVGIGTNVGNSLIDGVLGTVDQIPKATSQIANSLVRGVDFNSPIAGFDLSDPSLIGGQAPVQVSVENNIDNKMDLALVERRITNTILKALNR